MQQPVQQPVQQSVQQSMQQTGQMQGAQMSGYSTSNSSVTYPRVAPQQYIAQPSQYQPGPATFEKSAATAVMGMPNSIFSKTNPQTGRTEYYQTQLIVVDIQRNEYGFGINLGDNDGVVRIQGCRPNPDGSPSPVQMTPNIHPGDVIYKVQNKVLTGSNPLGVVGMSSADER